MKTYWAPLVPGGRKMPLTKEKFEEARRQKGELPVGKNDVPIAPQLHAGAFVPAEPWDLGRARRSSRSLRTWHGKTPRRVFPAVKEGLRESPEFTVPEDVFEEIC